MYRKTVLRNGIRVVTEEIPHFRSISTGIWVNAGSRDERDGELGITHFIEHMLFKGTQRRSSLDIAKELDAIGGFSNAFTSKEQVCFHARVMDTHLPVVVDILADIFLNSIFDPHEIERERQVILQEINMVEDTPDEYVHILFQEMFWKDNPLGVPIYGMEETVERIDRDRILHYISRSFHPDRILVAAAGKVEHQQFVDLIASTMEGLNHPESLPDRKTPRNNSFIQVVPKDLEQVHVCLGIPGCSNLEEDRFICHVLNVVLGSSMSSRLFQEVREKRGLAYSVYSFLNNYEDTGMLGIYAGVGPENVQETLKVIRSLLFQLIEEPISEAELSAAKEYLKGSMYLNAESTDSRMNRLAKNEFLFNRFVPFSEVEEKIDQVTSEQIRQWFQKVFQPDQPALLLLGPADSDEVEKTMSSA